MTLLDANPLVAMAMPETAPELAAKCRATLATLRSPLVTNWACLAEAFHIVGSRGGWPRQQTIWEIISDSRIIKVHSPSVQETLRARDLMERYRNVPMDLADALLMAMAESLRIRTILTVDSDFRIYRTDDGNALTMIPE